MANDSEAAAAIEGLSGREVGGRALTVNEARPKMERGGGGGRGGFRGGRDDSRGGHSSKRREPRW
jgi:hypothetical protein